MNNIRTEFKKLVIEAIHRLPYDEAIKKEKLVNKTLDIMICDTCREEFNDNDFMLVDYERCPKCKICYEQPAYSPPLYEYGSYKYKKEKKYDNYPITIGRVMQALPENIRWVFKRFYNEKVFWIGEKFTEERQKPIKWKPTKENGQEADDDFQDDATIEALYNLLK